MKRVAINGFGRIGRLVARILLERKDLELVVVNDLVPSDNLAYLFQYDTVHGKFPELVTSDEKGLWIGKRRIDVTAGRDPVGLPWKEYGVDFVVESTGRFTHLEDARGHLAAGA